MFRKQSAYAFTAAALIAGCGDPEVRTDLRPEGDPEVLAVLVLNDSVSGLVEGATFCAPGDEKRPSLVGLPDFTTQQICPENLAEEVPMAEDAAPDTWYVRIMFDELLDPDIEDLIPILDENGLETGSFTGTLANTQPVTLRCTGVDGMMHDVPYDGYYSPSGNNVTWPLGPSLVIKQTGDFIVPTNSQCEVALKENIVDKSGLPVPANQRGPFRFKVAPIKSLLIDPADGGTVDASAFWFNGVFLQSNAVVDPSTICDEGTAMDECEGKLTPDLGGLTSFSSGHDIILGPNDFVMADTEYTFEITGGKIKDQCGGETTLGAGSVAGNTKVTFKTNPFQLNTINKVNGDVAPPVAKPTLTFSNFVTGSSVDATELMVTPAPTSAAITAAVQFPGSPPSLIRATGFYQPDTSYTLTFTGSATVTDINGVVFTNPMARTIMFKTQPIALTAVNALLAGAIPLGPANNATIVKTTPTDTITIQFAMNQNMRTSAGGVEVWDANDIEFTGNATTLTINGSSGCTVPTGTSCNLQVTGVFTPGDYQIKLKAGAKIEDMLGNVYTQAADRVVNFTVEEAPPTPPATPCLGS